MYYAPYFVKPSPGGGRGTAKAVDEGIASRFHREAVKFAASPQVKFELRASEVCRCAASEISGCAGRERDAERCSLRELEIEIYR